MSVPVLAILFLIIAVFYASVGFGGGSSYNALLVLGGVDYAILPAIALVCNITVVTGSSIRYARAGLLKLKRLLPIVALSMPMAWAGGRIPVSEVIFVGLLGCALIVSGLQLLFFYKPDAAHAQDKKHASYIAAGAGAGIGFLSGMVGIGGGIFLAPVLYRLRWAAPKEIAAACAFFILVNSLSGLAGQVSKWADPTLLEQAASYWPLLPAVLVGGQLGAWFGVSRAREGVVARMTGILIVYVALRLLWRWFHISGYA